MKIDKLKTKSTKIITHIVNHPLGNVDYKWAIVVYGIIVIFISTVTFLLECPSGEQSAVLRAAIAIAVTALFASIFSKWNEGRMGIKLALLLFLFLSVYLANPISTTKTGHCNFYAHVNGKVFLGDDPLSNATVSLPQNNFQTLSNHSGEFLLRWENREEIDSLLVAIQSKKIDTSFYWQVKQTTMEVHLEDTLIPMSNRIIANLVESRIQLFERQMQGNYLKWGLQDSISLNQLIQLFQPFEAKDAYYRNEFRYKGVETELEFRKNLLAAGITAAEELNPYRKHQFDSCDIYLIKSNTFPNYQLEYVMVNRKPINFKINQPRYHAENHYSANISFEENVRSIRLKLECSAQTEGYKVRQMEFYGFLPMEEYEFKFKHGEWLIIAANQVS